MARFVLPYLSFLVLAEPTPTPIAEGFMHLIWADEPRPAFFRGTVEPTIDPPLTGEAMESALAGPQNAAVEQQPAAVPLNQEFDCLHDLIDMLREPVELQTEPILTNPQPATAPSKDNLGSAFIEWLREEFRVIA